MDCEIQDGQQVLDDWPKMPDGSDWDGTGLLTLLRRGESPFRGAWDVESLVREVEHNLNASVVDIPSVSAGANHYGLHVKLCGRPDVVARLSRGDVNAPGFRGSALEKRQLWHGQFELAAYDALQPLAGALGRRPLYHRDPVRVLGPSQGIAGRGLFLFEKAHGERYDYVRWRALSAGQKACLLVRSAHVAATLFKYHLPDDFPSTWLLDRIFGPEPKVYHPVVIQPTREFCMTLLAARIECTFGRLNPGPLLCAVRDSLLRLVPRVLPRARKGLDEGTLYRFVLDHGDFGIHNMTISKDAQDSPCITSVYDWEAGSIVPALLTEPKMVVTADLVVGDSGEPSVSRWGDGDSMQRMAEYMAWSREYFKELFAEAPECRAAIQAGRDARHIWFSLRECQNDDAAACAAKLGVWAEAKHADLDAVDGRELWMAPGQCLTH